MKQLIKHWPLIKKLTLREIKARYKQSFLGFFWIILNPFCQMLILSFVFSKIMRFTNLGVPFPIYLYAGLLAWLFLGSSLSSSMRILPENASLIKKIYFPREVLILSTLFAKAFDFFLSLLVFFALMVFFHIPFTLYMLFFIPIFFIQFLFVFGLSLLLSALNLFYRDVQYLFDLILTLWFYLTPIIYPIEMFPAEWRWIFKINPMAVFINAYRQVLLTGQAPNFASMSTGILISIVLLVSAYALFKKMEKSFADVV